MRLQSLTMRNFRLYKKVDLEFRKFENDIHIIKGKNGVGKTTILNAINWCLYDKEHHTFDKDKALPLLNLTANNDDKVLVSISVVADNSELVFTRTQQNNKKSELVVNVKSKTGESTSFKGEEALNKVDDFVPESIREFFFFDGEHLDSYFLNNKGENVKHNIFILSHIDILESMQDHLKRKLKNIRKQGKNLDSNFDDITKELEKKEYALEERLKTEKKFREEIIKLTEKIDKLTKELEGMPDTRELEKQKQDLDSKIQKCQEKLEGINGDRSNLIVSSVPALFTHDAIKSLYAVIEEKEKNNELPHQVDGEIIQESLNEGICKVCNRHLDKSSEIFLRNSLASYQFSPDQSKLLLKIKPELKVLMKTLNNYRKMSKTLSQRYKDVNDDLIENEVELKRVHEDYVGYNENNGEISRKFDLREELKELKDDYHRKIGNVEIHIEQLKKEIEEKNQELNKASENNEKLMLNRRKELLCSDAIKLVMDTKKEIMDNTKDSIEQKTKDEFFKLIWKKETYETVKIDDSYQLQLIHKKTKKNSLGTASAAERELLSLSFTLGIHSISGFDAPLLIDTPLARISDDNRVNFVDILLKISEIKQIILIVTPAEYSEDIAPKLDNIKSKFEIIMKDDEAISKITEMK